MVNRSLVRSGFDIEVLLSERYLRYALLAQIEAGMFPTVLDLVDASVGLDVRVTLHPPTDYGRLYEPHPEAALPPLAALVAWQKELLRAARHDEHPWHAALRVDALVAQAAALWQTARVASPGRGGALATLPGR